MFLDRMQAPCALAAGCLAAAGLLSSASAGAQPASAPAAEMTANERAQRDADKVFKWILIHSDKPRKAGSGRDEKRDERHDEKPAVATRAKPAARAAEPAPVAAAPAVAAAAVPSAKSAAPAPEASVPLADAAPAAVAPPPVETALAPVASAATSASSRVAPANVPAPAPADDREEILQPLVRTDPKFPPSLLRTLGKGQVQVRFTVQPDGSVVEPSVVTMSDSRLRPAALAAVAQWRFAPLRKAQTGVVDLVFNLE